MTNRMSDTNKLTIIHAVPTWLPRTESWLYDQLRSLPPEVESHIVCEATENFEQFSLPNIHAFLEAPCLRYLWDKGLRALRFRRHLGFLVEQAKRYHSNVLHSHFGHVGWSNIKAAKLAGLRHVVTFYGFDLSYLPNLEPGWIGRYQALFEQADLILAEGPYMARCLVALGCAEHKVQVHHLGVMVDEIPFEPRVWNPPEPLRILIAASFQEKKGIPYALEALGTLQQEIPLEITIIGDANREPRSQAEKQRILASIHKHNLGDKVRMLGYQPHKVLLKESYMHHVFLSPSVTASDGDTEGGVPVSIIEMAATGMPVVSTAHCDIPEVIQHGAMGLLALEGDIEALIAHLNWLISHQDSWLPMLRKCRHHIETEYNAMKQAKKLGRIYQEIVRS